MVSDDEEELVNRVIRKLAVSSDASIIDRGQSAELRQIVERRLSGNSVWLVAFRGFIENPADADLRANLEFILRRIASSDTNFLEDIDRSLGMRPQAVTEHFPVPSVRIDLKGSKNQVRDVAGRDINKNRTIKIGTAGLLSLALLGGGSYTVYHFTQSPRSESALSASRMSLPGISVDPPKGWANYPVNWPSFELARAPLGAGSCSAFVDRVQPRCVDFVTISRVPSNFSYARSNPRDALQQAANDRFNSLRASIRQITTVKQQAFNINGCPAYMKEWRVSWRLHDTLEEFVFARSPTASQGSNLAYAFIILYDSGNSSPQPLMDAVASSIQCN